MNKKNKGFTLVELIVVLAILAILAALLIPSLTGYIDRANEKKVLAVARQYQIAGQATVSDAYAANEDVTSVTQTAVTCTKSSGTCTVGTFDRFNALAEIQDGDTFTFTYTNHLLTSATVTSDGYTATYASGAWSVKKGA